jgi:hypothetical protein
VLIFLLPFHLLECSLLLFSLPTSSRIPPSPFPFFLRLFLIYLFCAPLILFSPSLSSFYSISTLFFFCFSSSSSFLFFFIVLTLTAVPLVPEGVKPNDLLCHHNTSMRYNNNPNSCWVSSNFLQEEIYFLCISNHTQRRCVFCVRYADPSLDVWGTHWGDLGTSFPIHELWPTN